MKKIIINICFILIALTAVASVCACDADNCTEEVDLSGNNVENIAINEITVNSTADEITVNSTADEDGANWTDVNGTVSGCTFNNNTASSGSVIYCNSDNGPAIDILALYGDGFTEDMDIGSIIFYSVEYTDGCHWVISECTGAELLTEYSYDSVAYFDFEATSRVGIVKIDLVNSNGEVIDTRVTKWNYYLWLRNL